MGSRELVEKLLELGVDPRDAPAGKQLHGCKAVKKSEINFFSALDNDPPEAISPLELASTLGAQGKDIYNLVRCKTLNVLCSLSLSLITVLVLHYTSKDSSIGSEGNDRTRKESVPMQIGN